MEGFEIRTGSDFIHVCLDEVFGFPDRTCHYGGYEAQGTVGIQCGSYRAHGSLWFSTGEVWQFYSELLRAYDDLSGEARFRSNEGNFELVVTFTSRGHLTIEGMYQENLGNSTGLQFEIESDQSYLTEPLAELAQFVTKYGDNRGLHGKR